METKRKNKKNTSVITEDLKLNRGLNVKLKTLDINNPKVIEAYLGKDDEGGM